jgi:hypothetical protein
MGETERTEGSGEDSTEVARQVGDAEVGVDAVETPAAPTQIEAPPPQPSSAVGAPGLEALSQSAKAPEERKALLANTLQGQVASGGRIESQGDFQAVVVRGHRPNHLLHFFIGIFTFGLWWIVWFFIAVFGGEKRQMISVDEFGNVLVQKV